MAQRTRRTLAACVVLSGAVFTRLALGGNASDGIPRHLTIDHANGYVAFTLESDSSPARPQPLWVLDGAGQAVYTSQPSRDPVQHDVPVGWFPGGDSLLFLRYTCGLGGDWGKSTSQVLCAWPREGTVAPVEFRIRTSAWPRVVSPTAFVSPGEPWEGGPHVLYVVSRVGRRWGAYMLAPDSDSVTWRECVWGAEEEQGLSLLLKSWRQGSGGRAVDFWRVDAGATGAASPELLATESRTICDSVVSDDGSLLLILLRDDWPQRLLRLVPVDAAPDGGDTVALSGGVTCLDIAPSGRVALAWRRGWADPIYDAPATLTTLDLTLVEPPRPVDVSWCPYLMEAAWLSDTQIVLSVSQVGLQTVDVENGGRRLLWEVPVPDDADRDGPSPG